MIQNNIVNNIYAMTWYSRILMRQYQQVGQFTIIGFHHHANPKTWELNIPLDQHDGEPHLWEI